MSKEHQIKCRNPVCRRGGKSGQRKPPGVGECKALLGGKWHSWHRERKDSRYESWNEVCLMLSAAGDCTGRGSTVIWRSLPFLVALLASDIPGQSRTILQGARKQGKDGW